MHIEDRINRLENDVEAINKRLDTHFDPADLSRRPLSALARELGLAEDQPESCVVAGAIERMRRLTSGATVDSDVLALLAKRVGCQGQSNDEVLMHAGEEIAELRRQRIELNARNDKLAQRIHELTAQAGHGDEREAAAVREESVKAPRWKARRGAWLWIKNTKTVDVSGGNASTIDCPLRVTCKVGELAWGWMPLRSGRALRGVEIGADGVRLATKKDMAIVRQYTKGCENWSDEPWSWKNKPLKPKAVGHDEKAR